MSFLKPAAKPSTAPVSQTKRGKRAYKRPAGLRSGCGA